MSKEFFRRSLAVCLCLCMLFSLILSVPLMAEEEGDPGREQGHSADDKNSGEVVEDKPVVEPPSEEKTEEDDQEPGPQAEEDSKQEEAQEEEGEEKEEAEEALSTPEMAPLGNSSEQPNYTPVLASELDEKLQVNQTWPETGSEGWEALTDEEKKEASDAFYSMDPNLKQLWEPEPGVEKQNRSGFEIYYWRVNPETGELVRFYTPGYRMFAYPGETLYFFVKLDVDQVRGGKTYRSRFGWGFHNQFIHPTNESATESYRIDPFCTYMKPEKVMLDGRRVHRWDDKTGVYGETSTNAYPSPKNGVKEMGHEVIEKACEAGRYHYLSFRYTLPENLWYAAFSKGQGEDGNSSGIIGASAQGFRIFPIGHIDVRYVLDDDYRAIMGYTKGEEEEPLKERERYSKYFIIDELEDKQLVPKSRLFTDGFGEKLFPLDRTFSKYIDGELKTLPYKYQMWGVGAYRVERPSYESLILDIPGYEYVADDFELGTDEDYKGGEESKLPMFDYDFFEDTGIVRRTKHFYVTYRKIPPPPVPPTTTTTNPPETTPPSSETTVPPPGETTSPPSVETTSLIEYPPPPSLPPIRVKTEKPQAPIPATGEDRELTLLWPLTAALLLLLCKRKK